MKNLFKNLTVAERKFLSTFAGNIDKVVPISETVHVEGVDTLREKGFVRFEAGNVVLNLEGREVVEIIADILHDTKPVEAREVKLTTNEKSLLLSFASTPEVFSFKPKALQKIIEFGGGQKEKLFDILKRTRQHLIEKGLVDRASLAPTELGLAVLSLHLMAAVREEEIKKKELAVAKESVKQEIVEATFKAAEIAENRDRIARQTKPALSDMQTLAAMFASATRPEDIADGWEPILFELTKDESDHAEEWGFAFRLKLIDQDVVFSFREDGSLKSFSNVRMG